MTYYLNKYKVNGQIGYCFTNSEDAVIVLDSHVIEFNKCKEILDSKNIIMELVSSEKLPCIYSLVQFTNGRNNVIAKIDLLNGSYQGSGFGGNFGECSICYKLAYTFNRIISNDIKVYKLEGHVITKNFTKE